MLLNVFTYNNVRWQYGSIFGCEILNFMWKILEEKIHSLVKSTILNSHAEIFYWIRGKYFYVKKTKINIKTKEQSCSLHLN